jgi:hypothetical protein
MSRGTVRAATSEPGSSYAELHPFATVPDIYFCTLK